MKKFAVAIVNLFNYVISVEIIDASDIKEAVMFHPMISESDDMVCFVQDLPNDLKTMKQCFFDVDMMLDVKEIKS